MSEVSDSRIVGSDSLLWKRDMELVVGPVRIPMRTKDLFAPKAMTDSLRCEFDVEKTGESTPNKASVTVYNLSPDHRASIVALFPLIITAGYENNMRLLFKGTIKLADSRRDAVNWVTTIQAEDSGTLDSTRTMRVSMTFGPGTPVQEVFRAIALTLGIGIGNIDLAFADPEIKFKTFIKPYTVHGTAAEVLDRLCVALKKRWSIQDGVLYVVGPKQTVPALATLLTPGSGLIGVPERGEKGTVKARSLLQGQLMPGAPVTIQCDTMHGIYKVDKARHYGDTHGSDWYTDIECKALT
ncbi:MAG: hypothetical protein PHE55_08895 [Methylococcaceae bacterium]|nr:hypothetical protein [Methylococcaceae bacterium]